MAAGEKRKNIRLSEENVNFRMMNLIRKVHGMIDIPRTRWEHFLAIRRMC